ncbi:CCA tRNA nucleotidyltransferase [Youxingia wuxianensis]|uniref:HD domain-containing protein n=1 Tax=Youxingia wuxianensis TaxID=2763678 RepID=A0A926ELZ1_9FIRM|nr:HD domain-containing protein [Youxingia wuxianensis]MBC8584136.1 HD domain-containing protein [Youxingia wuxianensis]
MKITLTPTIEQVINKLESAGFEAFVVGGCVRDSLLGKRPHDWDVCTDALPAQVISCFNGWPVIETGLKHGTVTVIIQGFPVEITTYRTESGYSDARRPDQVTFVRKLEEDLGRRDFTINAMAYHPRKGLKDLFGGQEDLHRGIIRCVGSARRRFEEDALRILRALRFASVFGFSLEKETAQAVNLCKERLAMIAPERIRTELDQMLCGQGVLDILLAYSPVLQVILPEIGEMRGFEQRSPYHVYDIWEHTARSTASVQAQRILRLTMLLHDIGKPSCFTEEGGEGHFYGHDRKSAQMAGEILRRLKYDNETLEKVVQLVGRHGDCFPAQPVPIKRRLNRMGEEQFWRLLEVKRADILAQAPDKQPLRLAQLEEIRFVLQKLLAEKECFSRKELRVSGTDLIDIGIPQGPKIGELLSDLLEKVIEEELPNEKQALLNYVRELSK